MQEHEFDQLRKRMAATFPSLIDWFNGLDGKDAHGVPVADRTRRNGVRARWRAALMPVEYQDALTALERIAASPEDYWPNPSDRERAGAIVAAEAGKIASARMESERTAQALLTRRAVERAMSEDELATYADLRLCPLCHGSGLVAVLTGKEVRRIAETGDPKVSYRGTVSLVCNCMCREAQTYRKSVLPTGEPFFTAYVAGRHVPADLPAKDIVAACHAAIESLGGRREASFDEFNRRAV